MTWLPLTLLCAFALATGDALTKKALDRHNEYLIMWLRLAMVVPVVLILRLFVPAPQLTREFYMTGLTALPLEVVGVILYLKALKLSPLSLTLPFMAFTPVFMLVMPFLLLGETISPAGAAGILLIAGGSYILNLHGMKEGIFGPFRALLREKGSLCMLGVAFIYSITATLGKKGVDVSSPIYFASFYFPMLVAAIAPIALWQGRKELPGLLKNGTLKAALLPGMFSCVEIVSHVIAVSTAKVAYMIAVKRLSLLIGVVYGRILFKEKGLRERLAGATLMLAGVVVIVVTGM